MRSVRRAAVGVFLVSSFATTLMAVGGDKAQYIGGTVSGLQEKAEAKLSTASESEVLFDAGKKGTLTIPYAAIESLEYGQKAGRRVAVAVLVSPLALFSKKRNHYLTVTYKDSSAKEQAAVFELGKDVIRTTLKVLEVRSGKAIEFQDGEACRQYKTPKECGT